MGYDGCLAPTGTNYPSRLRMHCSVGEEFLSESELLLFADQFCMAIEARSNDLRPGIEREELLLKLNQARSLLSQIQEIFNERRLELRTRRTATLFHALLCNLHWCAFYSRSVIDRPTFRRLMIVQAGFSLLVMKALRT